MSNCGCDQKSDRSDVDYQYAAKLICGRHKEHLAQGSYRTCVNVHNPSRCDTVEFRWKVAQSHSIAKDQGKISSFQTLRLSPDEALHIDCSDAARLIGTDSPLEGWLVVESPNPLDIVAVYTATDEDGKNVETFYTERVPCRLLDRCADLLFELSTGAAAWTLADGSWPTLGKPNSIPPGPPGTVAGDAQGWADVLPSALWIHDPALQNVKEGISEFKYCFHLCSGFENAQLTGPGLELFADTHARVEINGVPLLGQFYNPGGGHNWHTNPNGDNAQLPVALQLPPNALRAGENCFRVTVYNAVRSTGMCLRGWFAVARGMCPGAPPPMLPCPGVAYKVFARRFDLDDWGDWGPEASNGATASGAGSGHRRIKGINIRLTNSLPGTSIEYKMRIDKWLGSDQVDVPSVFNGADLLNAGSTHRNKHMEYFSARLINAPIHCCLHYSAFVDRIGGQNDAWNPDPDTSASTNNWGGNAGENNRRLRHIRVSIVRC